MLLSQHMLEDGATRLRKIEQQLKSSCDFDLLKARFYAVALDLAFAAEELHFCTDNDDYESMKTVLLTTMQRAREMEDPEEFKACLNIILDDHFPENRNYGNMTISDFRSNVMSTMTRYSPLNPINIELITQYINTGNRNVNVLDPRCRDGQNSSILKRTIPNATVYGIESESGTAEKAKQHIDRVAIGSFVGSRISNDAFDVMFMEPPISWNISTGFGTFSKQEKLFLQNTIKYARPDGMMVLIIPYFRMYKDMCVFVSKNMKDIQIRRLSGTDWDNKALIAIVGRRAEYKEPNEETYRMLRRLHSPTEIDTLLRAPLEPVTLPSGIVSIETFRGSILDMDEMQKIAESSGAMDAFWDKQEVEKLSENAKRPLLPFNIGQIGLVLTSGCLDGIVDEGNGCFHVIKGRVSKKSVTERDVLDRDSVEVNETISNRVEINVMLPNGEYKVLA